MKKHCSTCHFQHQLLWRRYPPSESGILPKIKETSFCGEWQIYQETDSDIKEAFLEDFFNLGRK